MPPKDYRETKACFMEADGIVLPPMDEIVELHIASEPLNEEEKRMLEVTASYIPGLEMHEVRR